MPNRSSAAGGPHRTRDAAFTLIELLVCVAIIAILAGLILPALSSAKARGLTIACLNNHRQIALASALYVDDFRDTLPYNLGESEIKQRVAEERYLNWTSSIMTWERDPDNTNQTLLTEGGIGPYTGRNAAIYRCPSDRNVSDLQASLGWTHRVRSVSMNAMVGNAGDFSTTGANLNNPSYKQFFRLSQIPRPSMIFVFIEEHPDSINDGYFLNKYYSKQWMDLPGSFHKGTANLTFADGHAENHRWRSARTQPPTRPDSARLPISLADSETVDFDWLMAVTSLK